jgi:hypothetical protein
MLSARLLPTKLRDLAYTAPVSSLTDLFVATTGLSIRAAVVYAVSLLRADRHCRSAPLRAAALHVDAGR